MVFILWDRLLLLVDASVSLYLFLIFSGGGGSAILVFFPSAIVFPVFSPGVQHLSYPLRGLLEGVLMVFLMWIIIVILIIFTVCVSGRAQL